ncbi:MAG TPA: hypothetical protein VHX86_18030 [Tepidisphaeraceae bacterium]|jgi:hypothetical protein|nr:hypothetical protein [Tepidisphaeraceae bacterium]
MGDTGLENDVKTPEKLLGRNQSGAESGAVSPSGPASRSPALMEIIAGGRGFRLWSKRAFWRLFEILMRKPADGLVIQQNEDDDPIIDHA